MNTDEIMESASPTKRIISSIIDVIATFIPSILAYSGLKHQDISPTLLWFSIFIVSTCILVYITGTGTLGDLLLRLKTTKVNGDSITKGKLVLRQLFCCTILFALIIPLPNITTRVIFLIIGVGIYFQMFIRNKQHNQYMTMVDSVFKTTVMSIVRK